LFPAAIIWREQCFGYKERESGLSRTLCFTSTTEGNEYMNKNGDFHTLKGYQQMSGGNLTASMEDYLEMIYRMLKTQEVVRVNDLAERLNVRPSSASKMVHSLNAQRLILFEKYGYIRPTAKGRIMGDYLLYRHEVLNEFLCLINRSEDETEQVEKIEHFLNKKTISNIKRATEALKNKPCK